MLSLIFAFIAGLAGYAICTQVPGVPQNVTYIVTGVFALLAGFAAR